MASDADDPRTCRIRQFRRDGTAEKSVVINPGLRARDALDVEAGDEVLVISNHEEGTVEIRPAEGVLE